MSGRVEFILIFSLISLTLAQMGYEGNENLYIGM